MAQGGTLNHDPEGPQAPEEDRRAFRVLEMLASGSGIRGVMAELQIGRKTIDRVRSDAELHSRWEAHKAALAAWEARRRRREVCEAVLETGNISEAAARFGLSRVTVYKHLKSEGVLDQVRDLVETQRLLLEFTVGRHALDVIPAMAALAVDETAIGSARAAAGDVVRRFLTGPAAINVASAPGGVAVAGGRDVRAGLMVTLPSQEQLHPAKVHQVARVLLADPEDAELDEPDVEAESVGT